MEIEILYPEAKTKHYNIVWEGGIIKRIDNLSENQFICFWNSPGLYKSTFNDKSFHLVLLLNENNDIIKIRSLYPCIISEEIIPWEMTDEEAREINKQAKVILAEKNEHIGFIDSMIDCVKGEQNNE